MKITLEHLGKTVSYNGSDYFLIEGFEKHADSIFMYGTGSKTGRKPVNPTFPFKQYYHINGDDADAFSLVNNTNQPKNKFVFNVEVSTAENITCLIEFLDKRYAKKEKK